MEILNDLTKETSFHRFYLRWLAACWLPIVAAAVFWGGFWISTEGKDLSAMWFATPFELWFLIGAGQLCFFRRYSADAWQWAAATFAGGIVATFVWAGATSPYLTGGPSLFTAVARQAALDVGLSPAFVIVWPWSFYLTIAGGFAVGLFLALAQAVFLASRWSDRGKWVAWNAITGCIVFTAMFPLHRPLFLLERKMLFAQVSDNHISLAAKLLVMLPTTLLAGWVICSAASGGFLWILRNRRAASQRNALPAVYD